MKALLPTFLAFASLALLSTAKADDTLLTLSGTEAAFGGGDAGGFLIGIAFTPTTDITLTQFGAFAGDDPSATQPDTTTFISDGKTTIPFTDVLYTFSATSSTAGVGTVVTSSVIPANTAVNGDRVAFANLSTPVTLTAGTEYFIGSYAGSDDDYLQAGDGSQNFAENVGFVNSPTDVTLNTSGVAADYDPATSGYVLSGPDSLTPGTSQDFVLANVYFAGNVRYVEGDVVPEPSDLAYGALGLAALAFVLRIRRPRSL